MVANLMYRPMSTNVLNNKHVASKVFFFDWSELNMYLRFLDMYTNTFETCCRIDSVKVLLPDMNNNLRTTCEVEWLQVVIMIIFGLIVGLIYLNVTDEYREGVMNRTGAFFFIIMNQVFGNLSSVELFIHEREIFMLAFTLFITSSRRPII